MPHSAELRLCAMPHSAKFRIHAMPHSAELKKRFICNSALCHCEIHVENFLAGSALCGAAGIQLHAMPHSRESWLHAMPHCAELRLRAMRRSAGSTYIREYLLEFATICKNILTCLSVTQVGLIHEKNKRSKNSWDCPFIKIIKMIIYCSTGEHLTIYSGIITFAEVLFDWFGSGPVFRNL
jgi:hypothetical protein